MSYVLQLNASKLELLFSTWHLSFIWMFEIIKLLYWHVNSLLFLQYINNRIMGHVLYTICCSVEIVSVESF
jgi:hypothetical protein